MTNMLSDNIKRGWVTSLLMAVLPAAALPQTPAADSLRMAPLVADSVESLLHYRFGDQWFVEAHLGFNGSMSENIRPRDYFFHAWRPGVALSVGKNFSPAFGVRLYGSYLCQRSKAEKEAVTAYPESYGRGYYDYSNVNAYVDAMVNLHNAFSAYRPDRRFTISAFVGLGVNTTFGFEKEKLDVWRNLPDGFFSVDTRSTTNLAVRAGLVFSYVLNDRLDLDLDLHIDATDDGYNGVRYDDKYDGYTVAMVGVKYHLKSHYGHRRWRYGRLTDRLAVDRANALINQAYLDQAAAADLYRSRISEERVLEMTVSFGRDKFNITSVQRPNVEAVANYIKAHPELHVTVCGFADVKTAYPAYNMRLSKRRATAVYNMLTKQFGVEPDRLSIDYKGDAVQPYQLKNEWNRVVVFKLTPAK